MQEHDANIEPPSKKKEGLFSSIGELIKKAFGGSKEPQDINNQTSTEQPEPTDPNEGKYYHTRADGIAVLFHPEDLGHVDKIPSEEERARDIALAEAVIEMHRVVFDPLFDRNVHLEVSQALDSKAASLAHSLKARMTFANLNRYINMESEYSEKDPQGLLEKVRALTEINSIKQAAEWPITGAYVSVVDSYALEIADETPGVTPTLRVEIIEQEQNPNAGTNPGHRKITYNLKPVQDLANNLHDQIIVRHSATGKFAYFGTPLDLVDKARQEKTTTNTLQYLINQGYPPPFYAVDITDIREGVVANNHNPRYKTTYESN